MQKTSKNQRTKVRQRTTKACDNCALKRKKCTGDSPCDWCTKKNIECKYTTPIRKRGPPKGSLLKNQSDSSVNSSPDLHNLSYMTPPDTFHMNNPPQLNSNSFSNVHNQSVSVNTIQHNTFIHNSTNSNDTLSMNFQNGIHNDINYTNPNYIPLHSRLSVNTVNIYDQTETQSISAQRPNERLTTSPLKISALLDATDTFPNILLPDGVSSPWLDVYFKFIDHKFSFLSPTWFRKNFDDIPLIMLHAMYSLAATEEKGFVIHSKESLAVTHHFHCRRLYQSINEEFDIFTVASVFLMAVYAGSYNNKLIGSGSYLAYAVRLFQRLDMGSTLSWITKSGERKEMEPHVAILTRLFLKDNAEGKNLPFVFAFFSILAGLIHSASLRMIVHDDNIPDYLHLHLQTTTLFEKYDPDLYRVRAMFTDPVLAVKALYDVGV
ncbi:hypothetical protein HDV02_002267 [Globomyces sp. JEL0801]|nr:hypothetical protein HDV02_002267 [Globomyces sp. JEL0801]